MLKVRADLKPGDYSDPGWFQHPEGHQAFEYTGELPEISEGPSSTNGLMEANETPRENQFRAIRPKDKRG